MKAITSGTYKGKFAKTIPARILKANKMFIEVEGYDEIFMVVASCDLAKLIVEKGGQPVIGANGKPAMLVIPDLKMKPISRDDFETFKNSRFEDES